MEYAASIPMCQGKLSKRITLIVKGIEENSIGEKSAKVMALFQQYLKDILAAAGDFCYEGRKEGMDMDIEALIPHRERMRLIGEVLAVDEDRAVTSSPVTEDWPLYCGGSVDTLVTIELVAQTAALLEGWKRQQSRRGGAKGWLVGIKTADFRLPRIPIPAALITEVRRDYALEGYAVFEGTVRLGPEVVSVVSIQAFRPEENG
jgi:predicted hotdog family 3-hydroxylacyl-ACP dehydratase